MSETNPLSDLLDALDFAAKRHRDQRRKGVESSPYINHPIGVARILADPGGITETSVLVAAVLHDTIEDTETTAAEIESLFGPTVRGLVEEVTDDRSLPKEERKRLQIEHAAALSAGAKQIKIADKISNVRDVVLAPPRDWSADRRRAYLEWAEAVVVHCLGVNAGLDALWAQVRAEARSELHS